MPEAPGEVEIIVRGVCVKDGCVLLCHTKGADNTYLPGGHVEPGEQTCYALAREIMEEMGREAGVDYFLGIVEHRFVQKEEIHHEVNLVFLMDIPDLAVSDAVSSCEDYIEFMWLPLADIAGSNLEPGPLRELLPQWLDGAGDRWASTL